MGRELQGTISRMLDHGVIVAMGDDLEGFVPLGHLAIPKVDKPQYFFKDEEQVDLKVIKMDVENRRIVLSIAERLKDISEEATEEFIAAHPRLEEVVAADEAAAAEAEATGEDAPVEKSGYEDYEE